MGGVSATIVGAILRPDHLEAGRGLAELIGSPALRVRHIHGIAQGMPHLAGFNTLFKGLSRRAIVQFSERLIARERAPIGGAKNFIDQEPKFT